MNFSHLLGLHLAAFALLPAAPSAAAAQQGTDYFAYIGTYTGAKSKGIYVARFDAATGKLGDAELAAEIASPTFLTLHPNGKFLYCVNEVGQFAGKKNTGGMTGYAIDRATGKLTKLNEAASGGGGPCHLGVDKAGRNVLVANYGGGSVAVLPVARDGMLSEASCFIQHTGSSVNKQRQEAPHAHGIYLDAANRFAFVPDLGMDKVVVYEFDGKAGTLKAGPASAQVTAGSGPRHFTFHPRGKFAYLINELTCTVTAFAYDSKRGSLEEFQTISTLPPGESVKAGYSTAEIEAHPSGKFIYGSNRGHDTIAVYGVDAKSGRLSYVENESTQGKTPRNFALDPTGRWLLAENQSSDSIAVFRIDQETGALEPTGQSVSAPTPVCIVFAPRN